MHWQYDPMLWLLAAAAAISIGLAVLAWRLSRSRQLDLVPLAHQAILEHVDVGVIVLDLQDRVLDLNSAAAHILGGRVSEAMGQPIDRLLATWHPGLSGADGLGALTESYLGVMEARTELVHSVGGVQRHFDMRISPLACGKGDVRGRLIVLHDITRLKQAEQALVLAQDRALEASRLKGELLANVSHDLLTPLNAILGYADMLRSAVYGPLSDSQLQTMQRIMANGKKLTNLIYDLLDQAQVEAGRLELRSVSVSPADLVRDVAATLRAQAHAKGLVFTSEVTNDVPATLSGDPQRLRQILLHLAGNAIKFTAEGAVHMRVCRSGPAHWALQVSDTGCGIPEEAHHHVFDPFWQVDGSPTREHNGVGLGLSLVKQLVTLMGGEIELVSRVGAGSTFTAILPLLLPSEEDEAAWKNHSH